MRNRDGVLDRHFPWKRLAVAGVQMLHGKTTGGEYKGGGNTWKGLEAPDWGKPSQL